MKSNFNPLVSIIIPVYNGSNYVGEAIDSALAQTYKNIEVIIVNDGSTDNTEDIVKSYKDKRISYFKKENGGVSTALNLGIKKSKGEYISWLSHDDLYYPNKVSVQISFLKNLSDKNAILSSDYIQFGNFGTREVVIDNENSGVLKKDIGFWLNVLLVSKLNGCTLLIPKCLFEKNGYFDKSLRTTQDYDMWYGFLKSNYRFYNISKFLVKQRLHRNQDTISRKSLHFKEVCDLYRKVIPIFTREIINLSETKKQKILLILKGMDCLDLKKYFYNFTNVQISDRDLIGNKFNGHDLHLYLRERGIDSTQLVWEKESQDENTYCIAGEKIDRSRIREFTLGIQKKYSLNSVCNPIAYDVLYNSLFLNAEIVHFHLLHNFIFDINLLPIVTKLKPIVWTLHDPWVLGGHCTYHFNCNKWKYGCGECEYLNFPFVINKDNTALNFEIKKQAVQSSNFDVVVASKWMMKKVKQSPMFSGKKIHLIPFGINQNIFKPVDKNEVRDRLNIPKDSIVICFRCDYSKFKGIEYIEYLLKNLKTDKKVFFLLLSNNLRDKNITFKYKSFGWVKDDYLLRDIYNASDLFLMPSIVEAFGMMAIEAMSCGVMPIVLDGTSLPDVVSSKYAGVSVVRDKEKFLNVVRYYIEHDNERIKRSVKCLEYAQEKYNKENYLRKITNLYDEVIKNHKIDENSTYILDQLKKHMTVEPKLSIMDNKFSQFLYDKLSDEFRQKIKDIILIIFYKIDKIFPKTLRRDMKYKMLKYSFVRKYLIKTN